MGFRKRYWTPTELNLSGINSNVVTTNHGNVVGLADSIEELAIVVVPSGSGVSGVCRLQLIDPADIATPTVIAELNLSGTNGGVAWATTGHVMTLLPGRGWRGGPDSQSPPVSIISSLAAQYVRLEVEVTVAAVGTYSVHAFERSQ